MDYSNKKIDLTLAWGVLQLTAAMTFLFGWALSWGSTWMLPEAFIWKSRIMHNLSSGAWKELLTRFFDFQLFEYVPRTTRPLASAFEIADTIFRAWVVARESLCLHNPLAMPGNGDRGLVIIHLAITTLLGFALLRDLTRKVTCKVTRKSYAPAAQLIGLIAIAITFHGAMMYIVSNKVWGPFYYGAYFGVLTVLLAAELWKMGGAVRKVSYA